MDKVIKFLDKTMWYCYAHTWSLMDVIVIAIILPHLVTTYTSWMFLLIVPWLFYSHIQARKYNGV